MSRYFHIVVFALLAFAGVTAFAQEQSCVPRRTAEERAMKQTEMLARDLNISDSIVRDTLYRIHLRYAKSRVKPTSRTEAVERMNSLLSELKGVLTPKQFERLQSIPRQHGACAHRAEKDSLDLPSTPTQP